jgi:hypothetical protein
MSNFLTAALGLAFAFVVCLMAVNAIVGTWLRMRKAASLETEERETSRFHMV